MPKRIVDIEIANYKGIGSWQHSFVDLYPNMPHLLIAPNGFGKTSFANCFASLKQGLLSIPDDHLHHGDTSKRPLLIVRFEHDGGNFSVAADDNKNEVSRAFEVKVIKSKLKSKTKPGFGNIRATSKIVAEDVVLAKAIPMRATYRYKKSDFNKLFPDDRAEIVPVDTFLTANIGFSLWLRHFEDITKLKNKTTANALAQVPGVVASNAVGSLIDQVTNYEPVRRVYDKLRELEIFSSEKLVIIMLFQILTEYRRQPTQFVSFLDKALYDRWKQNLESTISSLCLPSHIGPNIRNDSGKLIFELKNIDRMSNGERDALCFLADLYSTEYELLFRSKKEMAILVVDEIFDYLDESNLISCHYFLSKIISNFKDLSRSIYPLILTHLPPGDFEGFKFSKVKLHFLKPRSSGHVCNDVRRVLAERNENNIPLASIDNLSKYFLHYDPSQAVLPREVKRVSVTNNNEFYSVVKAELQNYLNGGTAYDPFSVCVSLRVEFEKWAYNKLSSQAEKNIFLLTKSTNEKLDYVESRGVLVPETLYLLGIIYNEALHVREQRMTFFANRIASNLGSEIITSIIRQSLDSCGIVI